jgi:O-antigen/teichoic acid export membrane protein
MTAIDKHIEAPKIAENDATSKQIRGSSLLVVGKFLSVGLNLATQVLLVRYLTKSDYGSWTYALAAVAFFQTFSTLGLKRSISRFLPIFHEKEEFDKLFGTIALAIATILISGLIIITAVYISPELISQLISGNKQPALLLLILVFLVPVEAIDGLLIGIFASFMRPGAIFFRKHVLAPLLKLAVVLLLILLEKDVYFVAYGYLFGSLIGVLIYAKILSGLLHQQGLRQHLSLNSINIPFKEIFLFTIPLLSSDLLEILMHSMDTFILGYFHGTTEVAAYQVVLPAARVNKMVMRSFALLYTPLLARLFAKNDYLEINNLYWRTAIWIAVMSFPIFLMTFSLAKPVTSFFYGERYESSWVFLQLLSFGYYLNVLLGFNSRTLTVLGKLRYIMIINLVVVIANLIGNLLLIPRYGALGATIATVGSMILLSVFKQAGLRITAGLRIFERQYLSIYLYLLLGALGVFLIQHLASFEIYVLLPLAVIVFFIVFKLCQGKLKVEETFPELSRIPVMRFILNLTKSTN